MDWEPLPAVVSQHAPRPSPETHGLADESGSEDVFRETIVLPWWLRVLAVGVLLCSVSGTATILIIDQRRQDGRDRPTSETAGHP